MLLEVEIHDFAIVEHARLTLDAGFCVLSGETGAGKSIVIDAIGALLGQRVGPDIVRLGAPAARLRAVFDLSDAPAAEARLTELGFTPEPDGLCVITREITPAGRGRCTVNGSAATVTMLRALGETLLDIHGQHDHQSLLRVAEHRPLLDAIGGPDLAAALANYRGAYGRWREALDEIRQLRVDEGEKARRADMLRFQVDEIGSARLQPGEVEELESERGRLAHAEKLVELAGEAYAALAEADDAPAAADRIGAALDAVRDMAEWDAELTSLADELDAAQAAVVEAARTLARYAEQVEADPQRLDGIETRLALIERLAKKYGPTPEAILEFGQRAAAELEAIEESDERLARLEQAMAGLEDELVSHACRLSQARAEAAAGLTGGVETHLRDLGMNGVTFQIALARRPASEADGVGVDGEPVAVSGDGIDAVEFLFSANPGEPPRPLAKIASGGEISRVMLALKSQLAEADPLPTLIFDEIDVGIGGVTIHAVGRKLAAIAARRQVVCITHHAPIAAMADVHVAVEKAAAGAATEVEVRRLEGEARVRELARMLGRQPPTEATLAMARELLAEWGR